MFNIFAYDTDIDKNKKKCMPKGKEEMTMEMKSIKATFANVFSPAHLKKIAAAAVLCATVTAGSAYMHMQQAEAHNAAKAQTRAEMVRTQAAEQGIELIDEAQVRAITAAAIGKDESELSMWEIKLKTRDHDKRYRNDGQTFSPVYKVECHAGTMEYELRIDAVTGDVLSYEAEVDDDRF